MRKVLSFGFIVAALAVAASPAFADSITVEYTADNVVDAFYQNGAAPVVVSLGTNSADWTKTDTTTLTGLSAGHTYQLVFRVSNLGNWSSGNPAGFLAELSGDVSLVSSSDWQYAVDTGGAVPSDFNSLTWTDTTEYGNNGGANIWGSKPGLSGISSSAQWLWDGNNFENGVNKDLWIRVSFSTPVPEPGTLALLGLGLTGLGFAARRKRRLAT